MHQIQTTIGLVAAVLEIAQSIPYYISILKGNTRPQRASYGIWLAVELIGVSSYIASGATTTKWVPIISTFNSLMVFSLSLKYGMGGTSKLDFFSLGLAGLAITLWVSTDNPALAVYMSLLAGCVGYVPTIKKAYIWPKTENTLSWAMYAGATGLNILALTTSRLVIALPVLLTFLFSILLAGILLLPRLQILGYKRYDRLPKPQEL